MKFEYMGVKRKRKIRYFRGESGGKEGGCVIRCSLLKELGLEGKR